MKEKLLGKKKDSGESCAIKNPKNCDLIFNPAGIKETSVKYCKDLLTNRDAEEEYVEDLKWKREVHNVRMTENAKNEMEFSQEMFLKSLEMIRQKGKEKYKFIKGAGQAYLAALYKLF